MKGNGVYVMFRRDHIKRTYEENEQLRVCVNELRSENEQLVKQIQYLSGVVSSEMVGATEARRHPKNRKK